jgi:hypothetical protein
MKTTAVETTTVETAAATEAAASAAVKTTTAATAVPDFGRQIAGCEFRRRRRAGTRKRERLGALR